MAASISHLSANTIADVINLGYTNFQTGSSLHIAGESTSNDGNGGRYIYDADSVVTDDGFLILRQSIKGVNDPGRWFRVDINQVAVATRSLNNSFQPSTKRNVLVNYSVSIEVVSALLGVNSGTVSLQTSPDNSNWTTVSQVSKTLSGVVATNNDVYNLSAFVLKGYYVRLLTSESGTNGASFDYITGHEASI